MNKIYHIITLCAIVITLASCGGGKGKSESKTNYHDSVAVACNNFDFAKAYLYAEKCDAKDEVIKKEGAYVLEQQGESGLVRISMIVNEHNAPWLYLDMLKMAISMGKESLATRLYKMSDACDEQAMDYAVTADMEGLVNTFISKNSNFIDKQNVIEYLKEKGTYDKFFTVIDKQRQEEKKRAEAEEKAKKIAALNKEIDNLASQVFPSRPALGIVKSDYHGEIPSGYTYYRNRVDEFNAECRKLLAKMIKEKNLPCAKKVVAMAKTSIVWNDLGDWCKVVEKSRNYSVYEAYKVAEDNTEQKAIQQLLNEAIRNGSFK